MTGHKHMPSTQEVRAILNDEGIKKQVISTADFDLYSLLINYGKKRKFSCYING